MPIHKEGDRLRVTNYRPISLIPNIAKMIEKIIKQFLETNRIISDHQFGFRNGKSTLCAVTRSIYRCLDEGKSSSCDFLDISKAFDTVCHGRLFIGEAGKLWIQRADS